MDTRPKLKLNLSKFDKILEKLGILFLILFWCLTIYIFFKLPTTIPIHYNYKGQVDNYGNKSTLFLMPLIATFIYWGLTQLNKFPHIFNYLTPITFENAEQQYTIATRMLRFLKLAILIVFFSVILMVYFIPIGLIKGPSVWFLPFIFGLILIPTIYSIYKSFQAK